MRLTKQTGRHNLIKKALTGICLLALTVTAPFTAGPAVAYAAAPEVTIASKDNKVPAYEAGKSEKWTLIVTNNTTEDITQAVIAPELGDSSDKWPFQTQYQDYKQVIDIPAESSVDVEYEFTCREDVPTTRYTLQFTLSIGDEIKTAQNFYVNTTAKPKEDKTEDNKAPKEDKTDDSGKTDKDDAEKPKEEEAQKEPVEQSVDEGLMLADAGGISNGDVSYSGGGGSYGSGNSSVPRVIVTGFSTDPAEVRAGSNFTLTIHLKNTSSASRVGNMLFTLSAPTAGTDEQTTSPAFLPTSGSNSIYLDGIPAGGTADISIQLNAKADLLQKPYSIDMSMLYEDASASQIEASSSLSIPVKQDARFECSEFEISPESIAVGEESNVMCNLYNLGRIKLYNVKATFEGACIKKTEEFLGNVESGATAAIDVMLEGTKTTKSAGKVTMTLSYEDESGNVNTYTKDLKLEVTEASDDVPAVTEDMAETSGGLSTTVIGLIVVILLAAAVFIVLRIRKKKHNNISNEEEALLDELDRSSEDEQQ